MTRTAPARPAPDTGTSPDHAAAPSLAGRARAAGLRVVAAAAWPESEADRVPPPLAGFVVSSFSPLAAETARRCLERRPAPVATARTGTHPPYAAHSTVTADAAEATDAVDEADATAGAYFPRPAAATAAGVNVNVKVKVNVKGNVTGIPSAADTASTTAYAVAAHSTAPADCADTPGAMAAGDRADAPVTGKRPVTAVVVVSALGDLAGAVHVAEVTDGGGRPGPLLFFQAVPNAVAGHVAARWGLTGPVVCVADTRAGLEVAALLLQDGDADEALLIRVDQAATAAERDRAAAVLLEAEADTDTAARPDPRPHHYEGEQP